jgi:hypothetical protein
VSARAHEVIPEEVEEEEKEKSDPDIMVDDSLKPIIDKNYPVAAQIEVIYSISQSFRRLKIDKTDEPNATDAPSGDIKEEEKDGKSDDVERQLETSWVAVFEGMLSDGTKSTDNSLHWKLIDNRPAWEFPGMDMPR